MSRIDGTSKTDGAKMTDQIEVTVLRPGLSSNGLRYGEPVLAASLPLWAGAPSFCDHPGPLDAGRAGGRSVRDLVGVCTAPRYEPARGVVATLRLYPHARWLAEVVAAHLADEAAGRPTAKLGISADMVVLKESTGERLATRPGQHAERPVYEVVKLLAVNSADVVMNPSAGGRFERIVAGGHLTPSPSPQAERRASGIPHLRYAERGSGGEVGPAVTAAAQKEKETPTMDQMMEGTMDQITEQTMERVVEQTMEQTTGQATERPMGVAAPGAAGGAEGRRAAPPESLSGLGADLCGQVLEARLATLALPERAREFIRAQFRGRVFGGAELDRAIEGVRGLLGDLAAPSVITGAGALRSPHYSPARITATPRVRMQAALDILFGLPVPDELKSVPRLTGIREAYILLTGDRFFTGRYHHEDSVLEANEITTTILADALTDTLAKRLVKDYQGQPRWWESIAVKVPLNDMRTQTRVLLNDFAALATVAENGTYANIAWGDTKETYTVAKKGNIAYVTLEAIINDDLRAVQRIPTKLAIAANTTVNELLSALFTTGSGAGPAMADTYTVFDATNHQGNSGTSNLASSALQSALVVLAKMTNSASKRIGVLGKHLLVPPDLMYTAAVIAQSPLLPGSANNDLNVLRGAINPIVVPQWTDTNNWYLMADPSQIECIEVGFLNGRQEPELLTQDNPTNGTVFTNDAISFKVRHIYGCGWLDYRGAYASIVA